MLFLGYEPREAIGVEFIAAYAIKDDEHLATFLNNIHIVKRELIDIKYWYVLRTSELGSIWAISISNPETELVKLKDWVRDSPGTVALTKEVLDFFLL